MAKRKLKPIPRFASDDEAAEFWDTHDSTEYIDWSRAQRAVFPNLKLSTQTISLRMPTGLLAELRMIANSRDIPYQSLIKQMLAERVREELRRGR
jgi:predicted DNA binding CopG/RHH family protein